MFSLKAPAEGGASTDLKGQYIVIWKKDADGNWRLHRDIWNTGPSQ
jgi:ketosteroid isomerase-like protein